MGRRFLGTYVKGRLLQNASDSVFSRFQQSKARRFLAREISSLEVGSATGGTDAWGGRPEGSIHRPAVSLSEEKRHAGPVGAVGCRL